MNYTQMFILKSFYIISNDRELIIFMTMNKQKNSMSFKIVLHSKQQEHYSKLKCH